MKRNLAPVYVALGFWMCESACAGATPSSLTILSQQAPNASAWVLAPLDETVSSDIRQNLTFLREGLLDEGTGKTGITLDAYRLGHQLCSTLLSALDERDQALVRAGVTVAQANANVAITSQALEARRSSGGRVVTTQNGLTTTIVKDLSSWPQYFREKDQRAELERRADSYTALIKERPKVEWSNRVAQMRTELDGLYVKFRQSLRQDTALMNSIAALPAEQTNKEPTPGNKPTAPTVTAIPEVRAEQPADPQVRKMTERMVNTSWSWIHPGTEMTFLEGGRAVCQGQDVYKWRISESDPQLLEGRWWGRTFEFKISEDFKRAEAVMDKNREWTSRLLEKNVKRKESK